MSQNYNYSIILSCSDDVLNRIFGEPVGMDYILALKSGVDSRSNSTILFNESPCFTNYGGSYGFDVSLIILLTRDMKPGYVSY